LIINAAHAIADRTPRRFPMGANGGEQPNPSDDNGVVHRLVVMLPFNATSLQSRTGKLDAGALMRPVSR